MKLEEEEFYRSTKKQIENGEKIPKKKLIEFIILRNDLMECMSNNVFKVEEKKEMLETILENRKKLTTVIKRLLSRWNNASYLKQTFKYILAKKVVDDLDISKLCIISCVLNTIYLEYQSKK